MDDDVFPFVQLYTPGSDFATGFFQNQFLAGRDGNEALLGFQPANPEQPQLDILNGDLEVIAGSPLRTWNDRFILGDFQEPYYDNGIPQIFGLNDFALITDFNRDQDIVQLNGTQANYQLVNVGFGQALLLQEQTGPDVIGFFLGNTDLALGDDYFQFEGNTPPRGTIIRREQQLGTEGFDITQTTATDPEGNVYIAGGTTRSLGEPNNGDSRDALVAKFDSQGNQLFTTQFGTSSFDTIFGIDTDNQGNFYVVGTTFGDLEGTQQALIADTFLAKFDSNGNQQWIQQFGQNAQFQSFSIDVDNNGNAYISGVNVTPVPNADVDAFVIKFDTNGNQQWFTPVSSPNNAFDESYGVTVANDGSVYATGWTLGNLGGQNQGLYDNWIVKLDSNTGQEILEFRTQYGSSDYEWSWDVDTDSQGNIYTTGWTLGNLEPGEQNAGLYDAYLTKFDSQGNLQFIRQFGTAGDDEAFNINIDANDNIFLTGYTDNNLGGTNAGSFDAWVAKFDTNGNQQAITQFGTPDLDQGLGITSDNANNLYVTGITEGSLGATNAGSVDSFLAKLDAQSLILQDFTSTPQPV